MNLRRAQAIVERACAEAEDRDLAIGVVVADAGGHAVAAARMDGAGFMTVALALAKAWTAAAVELPTSALAAGLADQTNFAVAAAAATDGEFILVGGGAPIVEEGKVVGGVGASGGTAEQDAAAAEAAAVA